jgi:membrane-bound lytic murein transglycosylase
MAMILGQNYSFIFYKTEKDKKAITNAIGPFGMLMKFG